jgi:esterase/lipase
MELKISEEETKDLLKQVFSELLEERRDIFTEIIIEAIEEIGIANAILEGRQDNYVDESKVLSVLRDRTS